MLMLILIKINVLTVYHLYTVNMYYVYCRFFSLASFTETKHGLICSHVRIVSCGVLLCCFVTFFNHLHFIEVGLILQKVNNALCVQCSSVVIFTEISFLHEVNFN